MILSTFDTFLKCSKDAFVFATILHIDNVINTIQMKLSCFIGLGVANQSIIGSLVARNNFLGRFL